jgi:hypothetical protein
MVSVKQSTCNLDGCFGSIEPGRGFGFLLAVQTSSDCRIRVPYNGRATTWHNVCDNPPHKYSDGNSIVFILR